MPTRENPWVVVFSKKKIKDLVKEDHEGHPPRVILHDGLNEDLPK